MFNDYQQKLHNIDKFNYLVLTKPFCFFCFPEGVRVVFTIQNPCAFPKGVWLSPQNPSVFPAMCLKAPLQSQSQTQSQGQSPTSQHLAKNAGLSKWCLTPDFCGQKCNFSKNSGFAARLPPNRWNHYFFQNFGVWGSLFGEFGPGVRWGAPGHAGASGRPGRAEGQKGVRQCSASFGSCTEVAGFGRPCSEGVRRFPGLPRGLQNDDFCG